MWAVPAGVSPAGVVAGDQAVQCGTAGALLTQLLALIGELVVVMVPFWR